MINLQEQKNLQMQGDDFEYKDEGDPNDVQSHLNLFEEEQTIKSKENEIEKLKAEISLLEKELVQIKVQYENLFKKLQKEKLKIKKHESSNNLLKEQLKVKQTSEQGSIEQEKLMLESISLYEQRCLKVEENKKLNNNTNLLLINLQKQQVKNQELMLEIQQLKSIDNQQLKIINLEKTNSTLVQQVEGLQLEVNKLSAKQIQQQDEREKSKQIINFFNCQFNKVIVKDQEVLEKINSLQTPALENEFEEEKKLLQNLFVGIIKSTKPKEKNTKNHNKQLTIFKSF